jgi:hypothetical protein
VAHAEQLQEQGPGLLDVFAAGRGYGIFGGDPEAEGGDDLFSAGAVEKIERYGDGGDGAEDG